MNEEARGRAFEILSQMKQLSKEYAMLMDQHGDDMGRDHGMLFLTFTPDNREDAEDTSFHLHSHMVSNSRFMLLHCTRDLLQTTINEMKKEEEAK